MPSLTNLILLAGSHSSVNYMLVCWMYISNVILKLLYTESFTYNKAILCLCCSLGRVRRSCCRPRRPGTCRSCWGCYRQAGTSTLSVVTSWAGHHCCWQSSMNTRRSVGEHMEVIVRTRGDQCERSWCWVWEHVEISVKGYGAECENTWRSVWKVMVLNVRIHVDQCERLWCWVWEH